MTEADQVSLSIKMTEFEFENIALKEQLRDLHKELRHRKKVESLNKYFEVSMNIPPINYE